MNAIAMLTRCRARQINAHPGVTDATTELIAETPYVAPDIEPFLVTHPLPTDCERAKEAVALGLAG